MSKSTTYKCDYCLEEIDEGYIYYSVTSDTVPYDDGFIQDDLLPDGIVWKEPTHEHMCVLCNKKMNDMFFNEQFKEIFPEKYPEIEK